MPDNLAAEDDDSENDDDEGDDKDVAVSDRNFFDAINFELSDEIVLYLYV